MDGYRFTVDALLRAREMSTAQFAEAAGLTYTQALTLRRGGYGRLDLATLTRVCDALGVTVADVVVREELAVTT